MAVIVYTILVLNFIAKFWLLYYNRKMLVLKDVQIYNYFSIKIGPRGAKFENITVAIQAGGKTNYWCVTRQLCVDALLLGYSCLYCLLDL